MTPSRVGCALRTSLRGTFVHYGLSAPGSHKGMCTTAARLPTAFLSHDDCIRHDPGSGHPETPLRLPKIYDQLKKDGLWDRLLHHSPSIASHETITRVHSTGYVKVAEVCHWRWIRPLSVLVSMWSVALAVEGQGCHVWPRLCSNGPSSCHLPIQEPTLLDPRNSRGGHDAASSCSRFSHDSNTDPPDSDLGEGEADEMSGGGGSGACYLFTPATGSSGPPVLAFPQTLTRRVVLPFLKSCDLFFVAVDVLPFVLLRRHHRPHTDRPHATIQGGLHLIFSVLQLCRGQGPSGSEYRIEVIEQRLTEHPIQRT